MVTVDFTPSSVDDMVDRFGSEREAFVAAAVLPNLPEKQILIRVMADPGDAPPPGYREYDLMSFMNRTYPIAGTKLYRVKPIKGTTTTPNSDTFLRRTFEPKPHSTRYYELDAADFTAIGYDGTQFDIRPQRRITEWGHFKRETHRHEYEREPLASFAYFE